MNFFELTASFLEWFDRIKSKSLMALFFKEQHEWRSTFCKGQPKQYAYGRSCLKSDKSKSLTVALEYERFWAKEQRLWIPNLGILQLSSVPFYKSQKVFCLFSQFLEVLCILSSVSGSILPLSSAVPGNILPLFPVPWSVLHLSPTPQSILIFPQFLGVFCILPHLLAVFCISSWQFLHSHFLSSWQ